MLLRHVKSMPVNHMLKTVALTAAMAAAAFPASASLDPGAAATPTPFPTPAFFLFAQDGGATTTPLPFAIAEGDVILLKSSTGGTGTGNWAEVLEFENVNGRGLA